MTTAAEMGALQLQAKEGQRTQRAELMTQMGKNLPANQEAWVRSLGQEDSLKQEMERRKEMEGNRGAWWVTVHGIAKSWA